MPLARKKLVWITAMYWFLLLYIMSALVWWFITLEKQNAEMTSLRLQQVSKNNAGYPRWEAETLDLQRRKHAQYVGEGAIFMLLILVGAVFVYRATRRQWKLSQQQQNFMMAVTHELKTPIAVVKLNLETLNRHKLEPDMEEMIMRDTLNETDRLDDLCNNILLTSRLEGGIYTYHKEPVELQKLASRSVERFSRRYPQRRIDFHSNTNASIYGEPLLIKLLLNNLIENAIKYTPEDATISVNVLHGKPGVCLQVKDEGAGIPDSEKRLVFEKFYRMGNENTRLSKGTGLGLYLCRKIAHDHQASIQLKDNKPHGSIFTILFRIHESEA